MKKVFSNADLVHTYAQQTQNEGRNPNGSFYFHGRTLYSYGSHFAICNFVTNEQSETKLLFTLRTYSNTTAKQIGLARNATNQYQKIYCHYPTGTHSENFKALLSEAEQTAQKLQKAKKPEIYLNELGHISHLATQYAQFFGIEIPETLQKVVSIKDKAENIAYLADKNALLLIEKKREAKEAKIKFKENFKKWLSFETPYLYGRLNFDFLRLNSERIDTTQGVQIPTELGKRLYHKIKTNDLKVGDKVLNFEVNEVGEKIKIGCHTFTKRYLLQFGAKLV
jgi:hypothetical protein